jgi:hypothetical protein
MRNRGNFATAIMLIGIGAWFLSIELFPSLKAFAYGAQTWPLMIIGIGAFLALIGLLTWLPGFFIPACIVGGVGGLLYYQNTTGNWESWAYAWALIPFFNGVGILLTGLGTRSRGATLTGFWMAFISLLVFSIFGSFFEDAALVALTWPVLLILLGLFVLLRGLFRRPAA